LRLFLLALLRLRLGLLLLILKGLHGLRPLLATGLYVPPDRFHGLHICMSIKEMVTNTRRSFHTPNAACIRAQLDLIDARKSVPARADHERCRQIGAVLVRLPPLASVKVMDQGKRRRIEGVVRVVTIS